MANPLCRRLFQFNHQLPHERVCVPKVGISEIGIPEEGMPEEGIPQIGIPGTVQRYFKCKYKSPIILK